MRGGTWALLLFVAAGCWQPRYFEPRENLTGRSPDGRRAAVYVLEDVGGLRAAGEVRVWSDGARARYAEHGQEVVDLHVGIELENNGAAQLELDLAALQLEQLYVDGQPGPPLPPAEVDGSPRAAPGATARVDVVFRPPTTYPRAVDSFGVRFSVRDDAGVRLGQMTPFAPAPPPGVYGGWGGAYGPGGPWGYGPGVYGPWGYGAWSYGPGGPWGWAGGGWVGPVCR